VQPETDDHDRGQHQAGDDAVAEVQQQEVQKPRHSYAPSVFPLKTTPSGLGRTARRNLRRLERKGKH
jgi:hypothetical protein